MADVNERDMQNNGERCQGTGVAEGQYRRCPQRLQSCSLSCVRPSAESEWLKAPTKNELYTEKGARSPAGFMKRLCRPYSRLVWNIRYQIGQVLETSAKEDGLPRRTGDQSREDTGSQPQEVSGADLQVDRQSTLQEAGWLGCIRRIRRIGSTQS